MGLIPVDDILDAISIEIKEGYTGI